ncbi:MAG: ferredoxin--NADP reductase [Sneathiellales bacterium]|nr:ferredoxin--NADP reductase [Sneathiellales bacterium]
MEYENLNLQQDADPQITDEVPIPLPKSVTEQIVQGIHHWTEDLFSFRLTRPPEFRFRSGEFVMIGLMADRKPLLRAYSIASPSWDDGLDFYSIKVQNGPLTSRLQHIQEGQKILLGKKPTGTLVLDALKPGKRLFLLSTGTGLAPFASLLREPETYDKFDELILTHTCRNVADLAYGKSVVEGLINDPLVGEIAPARVRYYPTTTQEEFQYTGRITNLISTGQFFEDLDIGTFDAEFDRAMICGSTPMITDTKLLLEEAGLEEGSNAAPREFVVEKAFVA